MGLILRWIVACFLVFGGLAVAWRSVRHVGIPGGASPHLKRLASLSLGPRRGLVVVRAGGTTLLVGVHEHGMTPLGPVDNWPDDAEPGSTAAPIAWGAVWAQAQAALQGRGRRGANREDPHA